jgi:hypothetical protein
VVKSARDANVSPQIVVIQHFDEELKRVVPKNEGRFAEFVQYGIVIPIWDRSA